jgi:hypothetical protein
MTIELVPAIADSCRDARRITILAGHYCINPNLEDLSHEGEAEQASFRLGAQLHVHLAAQGRSPRLVLWINDIGISPEARQTIKASYALPEAYREILEPLALANDQVEVLFESTMRNTASTLLRKLAQQRPDFFQTYAGDDPSLVRCVDDAGCSLERRRGSTVYAVPGPNHEPLVLKDGPNPKCNLILATLYRHLEQRLEAETIVNIFNDIYINRIRLGVHVARSVLENKLPFTNIFCDGDRHTMETC